MTSEEKYNLLVSYIKGMHHQLQDSHENGTAAPAVEYLNAIVEEIEYLDSTAKKNK